MTPAPPTVTELTNRLLQNARIGYHWAPAPTYELSGWTVDELLVSADVTSAVRSKLKQYGWGKKTSVLAGSKPKPKPKVVDVEIWKPAGKHFAVEVVLAHLAKAFSTPPKVSPNHLLVPCANPGCYCPGGPPSPVTTFPASLDAAIRDYAPKNGPIRVAVIDTGYIAHPALDVRAAAGGFAAVQGKVLNPAGNWVASQPDGLFRSNGRIELLDGHGTFTAGVIAERCKTAYITLVGIRAIESAATEAAVIRAIYENADADVIMPVFAFHSLLSLENWTFPNILRQLGSGSVVVCPAGNEASPKPHYPAALPWATYPVLSVGSLVPSASATGRNLSAFSNYGPWVDAYTGGERVVGPHIKAANVRVEDGPARSQTFKGWSRWMGTSFATPKVAAAIVNGTAAPGGARAAANALLASGTISPLRGAGAGVQGLDLRAQAR